jgi:hypothetical protein
METTKAVISAEVAAFQAAERTTPSITNSTTIGRAATGADRARLSPRGV